MGSVRGKPFRPARTAGRRGALVVAMLAALTGGSAVELSPALAHELSYTVERRGEIQSDLGTFAGIATENLSDIRGWTLNLNADYARVRSGGDFRLILASPQAVEDAATYCSAMWSCTVGDRVLINDERWRKGTPTWPLSRHSYRHYVINHEVGHWLGLGHRDCPGTGRSAPVMMQQSKGLEGCEARVWPKLSERRTVARLRDVSGWPTPPRSASCTIEGTDDAEAIRGTDHADVICAAAGDDTVRGNGGFDLIRGGEGADELAGAARRDLLLGGPGDDRLVGWRGADVLVGGPGADFVAGAAGDDRLMGWAGPDELRGHAGDDVLRGKGRNDALGGGPGSDKLAGGLAADRLSGGPGPDLLLGWAGPDTLRGGGGADTLRGKGHDDALGGGDGADALYGGWGDDLLAGQAGIDRCEPGVGRDTVRSCER